MAKRLSKKELKGPDEFTQALTEFLEFVSKNRKIIGIALGVLIFALTSIMVYKYVKKKRIYASSKEYTKVILSNDTEALAKFADRFSGTVLGESARFKEIALLIEKGDKERARRELKKIDTPFFSKFSFFFKNSETYLRGSVKALSNPKDAIKTFDSIKGYYLKTLSLLREAVLSDMTGSKRALDLYARVSRSTTGFLRGYAERRYFYLKNQRKE